MIITIDGPVATGKSTIAKKLAASMGYIYYDTGAMYRAVALEMMKKGISPEDKTALAEMIQSFNYRVKVVHGERRYFLGDEEITDKLRTLAVSKLAALVSTEPFIRDKLVALQRELAKGVNAVFEGRDMGTVVFPEAQLKIFLTGSKEVRAKRRYDELIAKTPELKQTLTLEKVQQDLEERDLSDTTRAVSPLKKAPDAFEIDTSDLNADEVVFKILECKDLAAALRKKPH